MSVTDLTGYTWIGNETINQPYTLTLYINFNLKSEQHTYTYMRYIGDLEKVLAYFPSFEEYSSFDAAYGYGGDYDTGWIDEKYRTIQITGGTDVTNSELIAWLETNGILVAPEPMTPIRPQLLDILPSIYQTSFLEEIQSNHSGIVLGRVKKRHTDIILNLGDSEEDQKLYNILQKFGWLDEVEPGNRPGDPLFPEDNLFPEDSLYPN